MATTTTNLGFIKPDVNSVTDADQWGGYLNTNFDDIDSEFATSTINHNFADFVVSRPELKDYSETVYAAGNVSGVVSLDYTNGNVQTATATGNISSLTISNWPATGKGGSFTLFLYQDGTGSRTLSLASGTYKTAGNATITLTTTASALDTLYFQTIDAGTTILTTASLNWS